MSGTSKTEEKVKNIIKESMKDEFGSHYEQGVPSQDMMNKIKQAEANQNAFNSAEDASPTGVPVEKASVEQQRNVADMHDEATGRMLDRVATPSGSNETRKRLFIK